MPARRFVSFCKCIAVANALSARRNTFCQLRRCAHMNECRTRKLAYRFFVKKIFNSIDLGPGFHAAPTELRWGASAGGVKFIFIVDFAFDDLQFSAG